MPATNPLKLMCYNIIIYNSSLGYAIRSVRLSDQLDRMSGSRERTINLQRGEVRVELRASQTTCHIIGRAFGLDPETIWLKKEYGTRAFYGSPYIVFISTSGMLRSSDRYIYIYIYNTYA